MAITVTESASNRSFVELRRVAGDTTGIASLKKHILRDKEIIGSVEVVMTIAPYLDATRLLLQHRLMQLSESLWWRFLPSCSYCEDNCWPRSDS